MSLSEQQHDSVIDRVEEILGPPDQPLNDATAPTKARRLLDRAWEDDGAEKSLRVRCRLAVLSGTLAMKSLGNNVWAQRHLEATWRDFCETQSGGDGLSLLDSDVINVVVTLARLALRCEDRERVVQLYGRVRELDEKAGQRRAFLRNLPLVRQLEAWSRPRERALSVLFQRSDSPGLPLQRFKLRDDDDVWLQVTRRVLSDSSFSDDVCIEFYDEGDASGAPTPRYRATRPRAIAEILKAYMAKRPKVGTIAEAAARLRVPPDHPGLWSMNNAIIDDDDDDDDDQEEEEEEEKGDDRFDTPAEVYNCDDGLVAMDEDGVLLVYRLGDTMSRPPLVGFCVRLNVVEDEDEGEGGGGGGGREDLGRIVFFVDPPQPLGIEDCASTTPTHQVILSHRDVSDADATMKPFAAARRRFRNARVIYVWLTNSRVRLLRLRFVCAK